MSNATMTYDAMDLEDACPIHEADAVKSYTFGFNDAEVIRYRCGCCSVFKTDGFNDAGRLCRTYKEAAGVARLIVAGEDAFANTHGMK